MSEEKVLRISSTQIKKNMVRQFNNFYINLDVYLDKEQVDNLKKLRDGIIMVLIASNDLDIAEELLDVEEVYD